MDIPPLPRFRLLELSDSEFPRRFADLPVPPRGLWVSGRPPGVPAAGVVAIVGSRAATRPACDRVHRLAGDLARAGFDIVSGGALGIDAAAHRGALAAGGATFAVLGCGIDVVYPDRHASLFARIAETGGVLSEYGPGVPPRHGQFPARNRLVAALADAVIVGESRGGSGALITARLAGSLARPLLAIPGSAGADGLLTGGQAAPMTSVSDLLDALAGRPAVRLAPPAELAAVVAEVAAASVGARVPATAEAVAVRLGLPLGETLARLCEAELAGFVVRAAGGKFEVPRGN